MAQDTAMCRICLAKDMRLSTISATLQPVFETITKTSLHTPDKRPVAVCCICYSHLKKCGNLMRTSAIAESVLTLLLNTQSGKIGKAISESERCALGLARLVFSKTECYDTLLKAPAVIKTELDGPQTETDQGDSKGPPCPDGMDIGSDEESEEVTRDLDVKEEDSEDDAADVHGVDDIDPFAELSEEGEEKEKVEGHKEKEEKEAVGVRDETDGHAMDSAPDDTNAVATHPVEKEADKGKLLEDTVAASEAVKRKQPEDATANKIQRVSHESRPKGQGPHQCNICQWRFKKRTFMMRHYKTHTGEKPFECELCHYRFADKSNLLKHLIIHTGEKPFECKVCQKRFRRKAHLTRHSKTHTDEKPFECTFCHSRFIQEYYLTKHLRTHTGEKPYECGDCQRRFSQRSILIKHVRTHTGEKPHECDICHHRFAQKCDLKRHANKVHAKK